MANKISVNESLLNALSPQVLKFNKNDIDLGSSLIKFYRINNFPASLEYGWLGKLTGVPNTVVTAEFVPEFQASILSAISKNISSDKVKSISEKDNFERIRAERRINDAENILKQIDENGEILGDMVIFAMVVGEDKEDLKTNCERFKSTAFSLGCSVRDLPFFQKDCLEAVAPYGGSEGTLKKISGRITLLSTFLGGFFNLNEGFSDDEGFYFAKDINGGLMILDLFKRDGDRTNSNIVAVGSPGKGKSTAIKKIMLNQYMLGVKIIIIDPEREYDSFCRDLGGEWINLGGNKKTKINPLQLKAIPLDEDEENELNETSALQLHLQNLEVFFKLCFADITERQMNILNQNLLDLYKKFGIVWETDVSAFKNEDFPTLSDLLVVLKENKISNEASVDERVVKDYNDLILYLENLVNGQDQFLFDGTTTLETDNQFICLDTHDLNNSSERVKKAQYFNIIGWCWQQITRDRNERIMLICDEAYLLVDPEIPQTLIGLRNIAKRCRKYEGSLAVISQSIIDFLDPRIKMYGQALLTLPCYKIFLGSDGKDLQEIVDTFELKEIHKEIIQAGVRGRGLIVIGSKHYIFNLELAEYEKPYILGGKGGR